MREAMQGKAEVPEKEVIFFADYITAVNSNEFMETETPLDTGSDSVGY